MGKNKKNSIRIYRRRIILLKMMLVTRNLIQRINDDSSLNQDMKDNKIESIIKSKIKEINREISSNEEEKTEKINMIYRIRIKQINDDLSMTEEQKSKKIFKLMSQKTIKKKKHNVECSHYYGRQGYFRYSCCNEYYKCSECHNENENHICAVLVDMKCANCDLIQSPNYSCSDCSNNIANHYCSKCKVWSDVELHHCDTCSKCVSIRYLTRYEQIDNHKKKTIEEHKKDHKIDENVDICAICQSQIPYYSAYVKTKCNHNMHYKCHQKYIKSLEGANHFCPVCKKTIGNERSEVWEMIKNEIDSYIIDPIYENVQVKIYCNDCEGRNEVRYTMGYHMCPSCESINIALGDLINPDNVEIPILPGAINTMW